MTDLDPLDLSGDVNPPSGRWKTFGHNSSRARATKAGGFSVGDSVRVVANTNASDYVVGQVYVITTIDPSDNTAQARDPRSGLVGNWLSLSDVVVASGIGWQWLRTVLDPTDVALLSHFDGLPDLVLRPDIRSAIAARLPDLKEALLGLPPPP